MNKFINALLFVCMLSLTACQSKNVEKIYGKWEEVKEPTKVLDFDNRDENDNPTQKDLIEPHTIITFAGKSWKEGDGPTLETKYKEISNGIIAVYYNGQEYLYVKIIDKDKLVLSPKGNPQATMNFKRIQ